MANVSKYLAETLLQAAVRNYDELSALLVFFTLPGLHTVHVNFALLHSTYSLEGRLADRYAARKASDCVNVRVCAHLPLDNVSDHTGKHL